MIANIWVAWNIEGFYIGVECRYKNQSDYNIELTRQSFLVAEFNAEDNEVYLGKIIVNNLTVEQVYDYLLTTLNDQMNPL